MLRYLCSIGDVYRGSQLVRSNIATPPALLTYRLSLLDCVKYLTNAYKCL